MAGVEQLSGVFPLLRIFHGKKRILLRSDDIIILHGAMVYPYMVTRHADHCNGPSSVVTCSDKKF